MIRTRYHKPRKKYKTVSNWAIKLNLKAKS